MRRAIAVRVVGPMQWIVYPALAAIAATVLMAVPLRVFGISLPEPVFPLVLVFAWPMIRPAALSAISLFLLGLFLDFYWGGAVGLWALSFLAVYGIMLVVRTFMSGHPTIVNFALYSGCVTGVFGIAYIVTALRTENAPSLLALAGQVIPTLLLFPIAEWLIQKFDDNDVRFL